MKQDAAALALQARPPVDPDAFPDLYALRVDGACMEPMYQHDQALMFSKTEPYAEGDAILIFLRPECVPQGQAQIIVKILYFATVALPVNLDYYGPRGKYDPTKNTTGLKPALALQMLNPRRVFSVPLASILAIHKCVGPVPAGVTTTRMAAPELVATATRNGRHRAAVQRSFAKGGRVGRPRTDALRLPRDKPVPLVDPATPETRAKQPALALLPHTLRAFRESRGLTVSAMAAALDVKRWKLREWEADGAQPPADLVPKLNAMGGRFLP